MTRPFSILVLLLALVLCGQAASGAAEAAENAAEPVLYFPFDEGTGHLVQDASGHLGETEISYRFLKPAYTEAMEPSWREIGASGGSLLFDGSSTSITCAIDGATTAGDALTVSVWVAPRAFEWDPPRAAEEGTAHLTGIVGQQNAEGTRGFLLGYQRFGRPGFQVGTGSVIKVGDWYHLFYCTFTFQPEMRQYVRHAGLFVSEGSAQFSRIRLTSE